jgi:hypothetical protein
MLAAAALVAGGSLPAVAGPLPERVTALYDINFNGINVGTYEFSSSQEGGSYTLKGNASMSLLLGAIQWQGVTQTTGQLNGTVAKPASFNFDFSGTLKSGSTRMAFQGDQVTQVLHQPPSPPREGIVPVQAHHLKGVLDPMTAVLTLAQAQENPCTKRLPIYDGKQRFDLMLSPRGQVTLGGGQGGEPVAGFVCRVKYVPIAGHKADQDTQQLAQSNGIEIIMRPLAGTSIFVPHKVTIPTVAGSATLVSRRVMLVNNGQQQLAFAQ